MPQVDARSAEQPLLCLLHELTQRIPIPLLDELWIFPPHRRGTTESSVIVAAAHEPGSGPPARRRVITARYAVRRDDRGRATIECTVTEHGRAPADRVHRLIEGVLARLDHDLAAQPPRTAHIDGDPARWHALLEGVAADTAAG